MRYILISRSLARFTLGSLAISLALHVARMITMLSDSYKAENHPSSLPLRLQSVGLMVGDSTPGRFGLHGAEDWRSMIPHHGFVRLSNDSNEIYELSMYHQVHCLMGFRQYINIMLEGNELTSHSVEHVEHCSSYLSQLMLCAGDLTLEPTKTAIHNSTGRRVHAVQSNGILHSCRDWTQVKDWVNKFYYRWQKEENHYKGEDLN